MNDYELIRNILDKSRYTVAMCGTDMMKESGMPSLRAPEIAYQVEQEFGYSPEEIFSSIFYVNRPETFFKYYREWMLKPHLEPSAGFTHWRSWSGGESFSAASPIMCISCRAGRAVRRY